MSQPTDGPVPPRSNHPLDPSLNGIDPTVVRPARPEYPRPSVLGTIGPDSSPAAAPPSPPVSAKPPTQLSREQILDATAACLQELGYDGTTIRRIAKQLGCAVGSIYRYFDDKRELLAAVVQRRFEPVLERIEAGAPTDAASNLYAQVAAEQPELYRLMFWLSSIGQTTHTNTLPAVVRRIIDAWADRIGDRRVAESYWSQLHGSIMQGRRADDLPLPPSAAG
ncbi:MAG: TetR/AcrR family transcriptional regulator [Planctomycetota bacterium]